jgi:NMD protein affecting ribosome stability and mRNA decay
MNNYFEGYIQLRGCSKELKAYVKKRMDEEHVSVASTTKRANGVDYKMSSNKFLLRLSKELPKRFTGKVNVSRKLHTQDRQTGKRIYRMTLLFTELPYHVGDIIEHQDEKVKVIRITSKRTTIKNVKTGKTSFL